MLTDNAWLVPGLNSPGIWFLIKQQGPRLVELPMKLDNATKRLHCAPGISKVHQELIRKKILTKDHVIKTTWDLTPGVLYDLDLMEESKEAVQMITQLRSWMTDRELAERIGIARNTIYNKIKHGKFRKSELQIIKHVYRNERKKQKARTAED